MKSPYDTDERLAFRETVERFVKTEMTPFVDDWEEAGSFPEELRRKAGALGLFGLGIEEVYGGLGFDDAFMRAWSSEALAMAGCGGIVASLACCNIMTGPIQQLASEEIKNRVLPPIMRGEIGGSLAVTEPGGGSDVASMKTTARLEGGEWVINGSKMFITGGIRSKYFLVGARTGNQGLAGISLFLVEADTPGFTRNALDRKMGWWSSDTAQLFFEDCRVPESNLVGQLNHGFMAIMHNFNYERLGMVAQMVGFSKVCMQQSIRYAQDRTTFGKPLIRHQVIRHKIAEMSARIDMMESYCNQICWMFNENLNPFAEVTKAKFQCSKDLEWIVNEAMQILGGAGYLRGNPIERIYRDCKVQSIGGGSQEIMKDLTVKLMML